MFPARPRRTTVRKAVRALGPDLRERTSTMQTFVIERNVPGASDFDSEHLSGLAAASNAVLADLGPSIQWVHSYVAGDKLYCVYYASDAELIKEHARCGNFPIDLVTPVAAMIDPTTAAT